MLWSHLHVKPSRIRAIGDFTRKWGWRGCLVAVTGSTRQLPGLRGCCGVCAHGAYWMGTTWTPLTATYIPWMARRPRNYQSHLTLLLRDFFLWRCAHGINLYRVSKKNTVLNSLPNKILKRYETFLFFISICMDMAEGLFYQMTPTKSENISCLGEY